MDLTLKALNAVDRVAEPGYHSEWIEPDKQGLVAVSGGQAC